MRKDCLLREKKSAALAVLLAAALVTGCAQTGNREAVQSAGSEAASAEVSAADETKEEDAVQDEAQVAEPDKEEQQKDTKPEAECCKLDPHVYSGKLSEIHDENWWNSFYNLVDAIRAGENTFECYDEQVYKSCTDEITLGELYPVACVWVTGASEDGSPAFENGVGKIRYTIPKEEFMEKRQAFEDEVNRILAQTVRTDYTDFEKCFALYDYVTQHFTYNYDWPDFENEGSNYHCLMEKTGICCEIGGVYAYLLLACGVDAMEIQSNDEIYHAWTYVMLDGKGYYVDPTWGLREKDMPVNLKYFMETEDERAVDGFDLSTLEIPLFMDENGRIDESVRYPAKDDKYSCLWYSDFEKIDRDRKILYYSDYDGTHELYYEEKNQD